MLSRLKPYIPWILVLLAVLYIWWDYRHPKVEYQNEMVEVPVHRDIVRTEVKYLPCQNVAAFDKSDASKRLDVPDSIKTDEAKQITAAGEIGPYRGTTTVTAIFDMGTGRTSLLSRREPLPFFALMNDKEIGIRYSASRYDIYGRWTFLRLGRVYLAGYVEANTRPEGTIAIDGYYRW